MSVVLVALVMACSVGTASQYGPGVMEKVIRNRQAIKSLPIHLPPVDGYIAVYDCAHIGSVWRINNERFLVADCAGDAHTRWWMLWYGIDIEVDYKTAVRWHSVGAGREVTVCKPLFEPPHTLEVFVKS